MQQVVMSLIHSAAPTVIPSPNHQRRIMDGRRRELAAGRRYPPLQQRCSHRRRLLPPLLLLLLAVASSHSPTAVGSIFGGSGDDSEDCSRQCESQHCTAPLMRYGKYCGVSYTGCPGEVPCDAMDACCMLHDACVQATDNDYLNLLCNQSLLDCVAAARPTAVADTFQGNQCNVTDVADEITTLVGAAVYARGILHKP